MEEEAQSTTTLDACLEALANPTRREVIGQLHDEPTTVCDDYDRETLMTLLHNHLPKMADAGFIEYEQTEGHIELRRGPHWEELDELQECVDESSIAE